MKKVLLSLSLLAFAGTMTTFQSCDTLKDKVIENLKYDLVFQTAETEFTVQANSTTGTFFVADTKSETLNLDQYIKDNTDNQLGIDNINSAKIKSCKLTIVNPDAANNFQNFSMAQAKLNASGQPEVVMTIDNNPDTYSETLSLPVDASKDFLPYLKASTMSYILGGTLRTATTKELKIKVQFEFDINVGG